MWVPSKYALRAGRVTAGQWDTASVGDYSVAMGVDTVASGTGAIAMGWANPAGGGITASNGGAVAMGYATAANITATSDTNWKLVEWRIDGVASGDANPLSVGPGTDGQVVEVQAVFEEETWTLRVLAPIGNGSTSPAIGDHVYDVATAADVVATPDTNWKLVEWRVDGVASGDANPLSVGPSARRL